jgi:hypothetical protein
MKVKSKILFIIVLVPLFLIYVCFNYFSVNKLSIEEKNRYFGFENQNIYGFYDNERLEGGLEFSWTEKEAVKRVKIEKNKMIIAVFCMKPDIENEFVNFKIFINNEAIDKISLENSSIKYLKYDIVDMGHRIGETIKVKFIVDKLWSPVEYGESEDSRKLGIGVGKIKFAE